MGLPIYFHGEVPLTPETTLNDIVEAYIAADVCYDPNDVTIEGDCLIDEVQRDTIALQMDKNSHVLYYSVDHPSGPGSLNGEFEDFLNTLSEKHARAGWVGLQHHEPDQSQVVYGPSEDQRRIAFVHHTIEELREAFERFELKVAKFHEPI